jgi:integrase
MRMMIKASKNFPGIYYRIAKDKKKTFYTYIRIHGKNKWERIGSEVDGVNVTEAFGWRARRMAELSSEKNASGHTLTDAFKLYYQEIKPNNRTSERELDWYNRLIRPALGSKKLDKISGQDLRDLRDKLMEESNYKLNSLKTILGMVGRIYRFVIEEGVYQGFNPGAALKWRKAGQKRNRALSLEEIASLLSEAKKIDQDLYRQVFIAVNTGLRKSEIFNLKPRDISLENRVFRLRNVKSKQDNKERVVLIPESVAKIIEEIYQERDSSKANDKLFEGNDINWRAWNKAVNAAGLNDGMEGPDILTFHGLRHTYASLIADNSSDPFVVKSQLGHGKIETSMIYTHTKRDIEKARSHVDVLGEMITKAESEKNRPKLQVVHGGKV